MTGLKNSRQDEDYDQRRRMEEYGGRDSEGGCNEVRQESVGPYLVTSSKKIGQAV